MNKERIEKNLIVKLSFEFGVAITGFCDQLHQERKFVIANQLLRAGLSIGSNIWEAQNAESVADFIHKLKIACKEADESEFFLLVISKAYENKNAEKLLQDLESIHKVLNKIITSTKQKQGR
jgi:four helix bundle protein